MVEELDGAGEVKVPLELEPEPEELDPEPVPVAPGAMAVGVTVADSWLEIWPLATPPGLPPETSVELLPEAVADALDPEPEPEEPEAVEEAPAEEEEEDWVLLQPRLKRGVVWSLLPTIPKLGLGVSGAASCRV